MRITIISVGKLKERYWRDAIDEYAKRLKAYATVQFVEVADRDHERLGEDRAIEAERADIERALASAPDGGGYVVALDLGGTQRTSESLAAKLGELQVDGTSSVSFLIGGSVGLSPALVGRADERPSLGKMTLPHNLARVVLAEQVYRAFKILRNEPYHK